MAKTHHSALLILEACLVAACALKSKLQHSTLNCLCTLVLGYSGQRECRSIAETSAFRQVLVELDGLHAILITDLKVKLPLDTPVAQAQLAARLAVGGPKAPA